MSGIGTIKLLQPFIPPALKINLYGCYNSKLRSGLLNNFTNKYRVTTLSNRVEMDQEPQIYTTQQENFKKILGKYGKSRILIARQHFSMALLLGQLHRDFLRFVNWSRPCGRWGNFYKVAQGQHPLLCALSTAETGLSCPKSIGSIGGTPIF